MASVKGFVDNLIKSKPVVIFSKSYCSYCTKAKNAISSFKLAPNALEVVELDQRDDCDPVQDYLKEITGGRSVPRVFIGGTFFGGGDDTADAQQKGTLEEKLKAANALECGGGFRFEGEWYKYLLIVTDPDFAARGVDKILKEARASMAAANVDADLNAPMVVAVPVAAVPTEQSTGYAANTFEDEEAKEVFAVSPLPTCPHVEQLSKIELPSTGLDTKTKCAKCSKVGENWVCLKCFEVNCSRFVDGHALEHSESAEHPIALSYADLSIWCYPCNAYLDNEIFKSAKAAAMESKFGKGDGKQQMCGQDGCQ